ncbi:hypothetical protein [Microbacterium sp. P04]|uniref:hypothetical protein n=1 Tax=Microbacterium sp. P04 TaxID=3366947 RepID=UPI003746146A
MDRLIGQLPAGRQEAVREIVVDATRRGFLPASNRRVLDSATGSPVVGDVLVAALAELARGAQDEIR